MSDLLRLGANRSGRTLYVVTAGMNDPESETARSIRERLIENGVPQRQILIPSNPCPSFTQNAHGGVDSANSTVRSFVRNLDVYLDYTKSQSAESRRSYQEISKLIGAAGFKPQCGDRLVFIGYSLGGQRAVTMAELAESHGISVHNVITLGTPMLHNNCRNTKITHITSDGDPVMLGVSPLPGVSISQSEEARVLKTPGYVGHGHYYSCRGVFNGLVIGALIEPSGRSSEWSDFDGIKQALKTKAVEMYEGAASAVAALGNRVTGALKFHAEALVASLKKAGRSAVQHGVKAAGTWTRRLLAAWA